MIRDNVPRFSSVSVDVERSGNPRVFEYEVSRSHVERSIPISETLSTVNDHPLL